ncbi:mechanosensitive ion channel domain-containing protein, partial [Deinococcus sp.]|uniref:mechanosensitive ion channel family protein n=1 Tax=Deinococcus sp. TaxID=47478 RepID=UPI002869D9BD
MSGTVDTSRLLGIDALRGILSVAGQQVRDFTVTSGPEILLAGVLIAVYTLLFLAASRLGAGVLRRFFTADAQPLALRILRIGLRLTFLMLVLVSITALFAPLNDYGPAVFRVYLLVMTLYVTWGLIHRFLSVQTARWNLDTSLTLLLNNTVRAVWVLLGVYLVFQQFNVNLLPILGGLGVAGLAVGFAAQDILANLISGVTLLLDRPFRIGDWIRTAEHEGQVSGLTLRTTRLRTRDNEYVSIPNKDVAGSVVVNLTQGGRLRLNVPVSIAYKDSVEAARRALLPVMAA